MSRRVAILIASGTFEPRSGLANLSTPANDVTRLGEVLRDPRIGRFDVVKELVDVRCHATRVAVNRLLSEVTREDFVLIYYSGHGKLDFNGGLCLTMTDTRPNLLGATSMKMSELQGYLAESKCKRVALILDCCYSGAVGRSFTKGDVAGELTSAAASGLCILTASSALQTAMESPEDGLGVFTKHLVEGLTTGAADRDGDGAISHDELIDYVRMGVARDGHQRPESFTFSVNGRLPIAFAEKRKAGAKSVARPARSRTAALEPAASEPKSGAPTTALPTEEEPAHHAPAAALAPEKSATQPPMSGPRASVEPAKAPNPVARAASRRVLLKVSVVLVGFVVVLWIGLRENPDSAAASDGSEQSALRSGGDVSGKPTLESNVAGDAPGGVAPANSLQRAGDGPDVHRNLVWDPQTKTWSPRPGYRFANRNDVRDLTVEWVPGTRTGRMPGRRASLVPDVWELAPGYALDPHDEDADPVWAPGSTSREFPHLKAAATKEEWEIMDPGYAWDPKNTARLGVIWQPGRRHPEDASLVAGQAEGSWVPADKD